ncbi:hypothetical protein Droror1_Dr00004543 [Drosera rotundifolia]
MAFPASLTDDNHNHNESSAGVGVGELKGPGSEGEIDINHNGTPIISLPLRHVYSAARVLMEEEAAEEEVEVKPSVEEKMKVYTRRRRSRWMGLVVWGRRSCRVRGHGSVGFGYRRF